MIGIALLAAAILATGYGAARLLYRRLAPAAPAVEVLTAAAVLGTTLWLATSWALAFLHVLNRRNLVVMAIAFALAGLSSLRLARAPGRPRSPWSLLAGVMIFCWTAFAIWRGAILPPLNHDALSYHLPKGVMIMRAGQVGPFAPNDLRLTGFPSNYELLVADVLLLTGSDRLTEWIGTAFFLGLLLFAATLARRWWGSGIHVTAAVLACAASPLVLLHSAADKNDLMAGFFATGAILWAADWCARGGALSASLAVVCIAVAAGTKLTAASVAIGVLPFVLAAMVRMRFRIRGLVWISLIAVLAFALCGPLGYLAGTTRASGAAPDSGIARAADAGRSIYGEWRNLADVPAAMLRVSLGATASVPWNDRGWSWARHDLFSSHFGALFALAVIMLPLAVWRYAREGDDALRRERKVAGLASLIGYAVLLPIDFQPTPAGIFRYSFFLLPVVFAWTVAPVVRDLSRSRFRSYAHVAMGLLVFNLAAHSLETAVYDTFAPIEYVRWAANHPGTRQIAFMRDRAAIVVDRLAGDGDVIAVNVGSDTWIHPAYGSRLQRRVLTLRGDALDDVPAEAGWVAIDGAAFRDQALPRREGELYWRLKGDPRFRLVYRNEYWNQAVFRRVSP